mmetsp:Transcript_258/g.723  ORF Transcript_258/g.723 Transcript_258/m.723 type:complete len:241 (-) Transcript_258:290-1012(-)
MPASPGIACGEGSGVMTPGRMLLLRRGCACGPSDPSDPCSPLTSAACSGTACSRAARRSAVMAALSSPASDSTASASASASASALASASPSASDAASESSSSPASSPAPCCCFFAVSRASQPWSWLRSLSCSDCTDLSSRVAASRCRRASESCWRSATTSPAFARSRLASSRSEPASETNRSRSARVECNSRNASSSCRWVATRLCFVLSTSSDAFCSLRRSSARSLSALLLDSDESDAV